MGMTIGQGLAQGAQNYINAQEVARRRAWEDEERARQRKAWTARDATMTQLANADKEQVVGDVPAENWQDPPVTQRKAAIDPQQLYERQQRILSTSEDPALMTQGIGMYPQVEQGKELAYQRGLREKRNAAAKQYSDMLSAINEGRLGVHSGELHPAVAMKALGSFQSANLAVAGMTGQERWSFIDDKGKAQFRPITKADVLKLLDEAEANVRKMYDDAVMGLSAEDADKVIGRKLEDRKVGATERTADATVRNADSTARVAAVAESKAPSEIRENESRAKYLDRLPAASGGGGAPPITKAEQAELSKLADAYAATTDPQQRAKLAQDYAIKLSAINMKRGVPPNMTTGTPADPAAWKAYYEWATTGEGLNASPAADRAMRQRLRLPTSDRVMDALGGVEGDPFAKSKEAAKPRTSALPAQGGYAPKPGAATVTPADVAAAQAALEQEAQARKAALSRDNTTREQLYPGTIPMGR